MAAPVLLLGFNRPDKMRALIDAVRAAKPVRLYIAVDGPREGRAGEDEKCRAVQECIKLVDWPCEVKTLFRERNLGCKLAVSGAISWFFENEECGIILEDDIRLGKSFFRFATEMLERYKDDDRVGVISGFNAYNLQRNQDNTYHFSSHFDCWGWATWRRSWQGFDPSLPQFAENFEKIIESSRMTRRSKRVLRNALTRCFSGDSNSWAYPFALWFMAHGWLSAVPRVRLTGNVGFQDVNATNTGGYNYFAGQYAETGELSVDIRHPAGVEWDTWADHMCERMDVAIFPRALTWLGAKTGNAKFCRMLTSVGRFCERLMPWLFRV